MLKKYQIDNASFVAAQDIFQELKTQDDSDKASISIHAVRNVFPSATHKKRRVNGKSVWVYDGYMTNKLNTTVEFLTY